MEIYGLRVPPTHAPLRHDRPKRLPLDPVPLNSHSLTACGTARYACTSFRNKKHKLPETEPVSRNRTDQNRTGNRAKRTGSGVHLAAGPVPLVPLVTLPLPLVLSGPASIQARDKVCSACSGKRYHQHKWTPWRAREMGPAQRESPNGCNVMEYAPFHFHLSQIYPFHSSSKMPFFRYLLRHIEKCSKQYNPL